MYFGKSKTPESIQRDDTLELLKNCVISILEGSAQDKEKKLSELDVYDGLTTDERVELRRFVEEQVMQKRRAILRSKASQFLVGEENALDSLGAVVRNFGVKPNKVYAQTAQQVNPFAKHRDLYEQVYNELGRKMQYAQDQAVKSGLYGTYKP